MNERVIKRIAQRSRLGNGGCYLWQGYVLPNGYGTIGVGKYKKVYIHRASWEFANGPIPDGMQIHHACKVKICWNYNHLEAHTPATHMREHWICWEDEDYILGRRTEKASVVDIANELGLNRKTITQFLQSIGESTETFIDLQTHCSYGHPLSGENLYIKPNGSRNCRECRRKQDREWKAMHYKRKEK